MERDSLGYGSLVVIVLGGLILLGDLFFIYGMTITILQGPGAQ